MPLPKDPKIVETSSSILDAFKGIFGSHPGFRPAHAKGALLTGTFTPTPVASSLSSAPHFNAPSTPITARFSSSTGIPALPDTDPNGQPRGLAVRFHLPPDPITNHRRHTDIITHAVDAFPASTPEETLRFFQALRDGQLASHIASHPNALTFIQTPKPFPASFRNEKFFSVNAFRLVSGGDKTTHIRYRIVPLKGTAYLSDDELKDKSPNYLFDDLHDNVSIGADGLKEPIEFALVAQIADLSRGDRTDDNTAKWPDEEREIVELGRIRLENLLARDESDRLSKDIIFDPIPRGVDGVEASDDPLLDLRAGVYLLSGRERRAA